MRTVLSTAAGRATNSFSGMHPPAAPRSPLAVSGAPAPLQSRQVYLDPTTNDFASPLAVIWRREAGGALPPISSSELSDDIVPASPPLTVRERILENPISTGILGAFLLGTGLALAVMGTPGA